MHPHPLLSAILLSTALLFSQDTPVPADSVRKLVAEGDALMKKGDCSSLSAAQKDYEEAITLASSIPDAKGAVTAGLHNALGTVLMGQGLAKISNCARNESEREDYLDKAWNEFRTALNLDSGNALYRSEFVALSEVLKRKPEYEGGIAKDADWTEMIPLMFPLTLQVERSLTINTGGNNLTTIAEAAEMGMAPSVFVVVYGSINGEKHWYLRCTRENSANESNPCTELAPGNYSACWAHNHDLLRVIIKGANGPEWRFLDVTPNPKDSADSQDAVLKTPVYEFDAHKPKGKQTTEYPLLLHVYGAVKLQFPVGSLPAHTHCSVTNPTTYRTDVDCSNSGAVPIYRGYVRLEGSIDGDSRWWISCDAKWRWSKCSALGPGFYVARWNDGPGSRLIVVAPVGSDSKEVGFEARQMPNVREPVPAQPLK